MQHEQFIRRCLTLAALGKEKVAPNPMVGAVLVHNDQIIGEGYHQQCGQAHAEVNCFESVAAQCKSLIPDSTMYVSLEPCAHYGKTPPCAHRIVNEGVKRVVICNTDPFEKVAGRGIQILEQQGVEVITNVLDKEGSWLNRRFFTFHQQKRPYIILKWAQTNTGVFAPVDGTRFQISNELSMRMHHQWRREEAAILVGYNTALNDNPQLISRYGSGAQPLRIALDKNLKLPVSHHLMSQDYPTWIVNNLKDSQIGNLRFVQIDFDQNILPQLMRALFDANINSLIVEGGAQLLQQFIEADLWDEARVFYAKSDLKTGISAPIISTDLLVSHYDINGNELKQFARQRGNFAPIFNPYL